MVGNERINFNSLEIEKQITDNAREIFENIKMRIEKIQKSTTELGHLCETVHLRVISSASKLSDVKIDKAVEQMITDKTGSEDLDTPSLEQKPKDGFESIKQAIIDSRLVIQGLGTPVVFSSSIQEQQAPTSKETVAKCDVVNGEDNIKDVIVSTSIIPPAPPLVDFEPIVRETEKVEPIFNFRPVEIEQIVEQILPKQEEEQNEEKHEEENDKESIPDAIPPASPKIVAQKEEIQVVPETSKQEPPSSPIVKKDHITKPTIVPKAEKIAVKTEKHVEQVRSVTRQPVKTSPEPRATTEKPQTQIPPPVKPIMKKSIFSSDSELEDDELLSFNKNKVKEVPTKVVQKQEPARPVAPTSSTLKTANVSQKKTSLFDDSDSDSDLFNLTPNLNSSASKKTTQNKTESTTDVTRGKLNADIKERLQNTLQIGKPQMKQPMKKEECQDTENNQVLVDNNVLKNRTRGPPNRRLPTTRNK